MKTILTGIKPTGTPHIGNLLGAIRPAISMSMDAELIRNNSQFLFFIADYHALTGEKDSKKFSNSIYEVAATWLAFGLDPKRVIFYKQSSISEIFELSWILACHTPKGDMNRAHSYKAKIQENEERGEADLDHGVNMGLFTYPILMAADILLFDTNFVPVGKDQIQHVEIARSIAQRFNQYYSETFTLPKEMVRESTGIIPGLDGRKMSKSYNNVIPLFAPENSLKKMINRIVTDSSSPTDPKDPDKSHIFQLFTHFADEDEIKNTREDFLKGISWGEAKARLFEVLNRALITPREIYSSYINDRSKIDSLLIEGCERARAIAKDKISKVRGVLFQ